ncbi:MAG TPA: PAS domain S-box protein [Anaerolineales bacterium]|nr:PAS domain S-box protein [Anaerolineales bacterium]
MIAAIRHWLRPPEFPEDENKTRVASTLNAILLIGLGSALVYIMFILVVAQGEFKSLIFSVLPILFLLGLRYLLWRGAVFLAGTLLVSLSWLNLTVAAIVDGYGIRGTSLYGYILIVIVAGLLINWRAAVIFTLANMTAGLFLIYAENTGLLPPRSVTQTNFTIWSANAVFSVSAAFILGIALRSLNQAFRRAALSESYYKMLFEEAPDGILIVDENNRILMANAAIYKMTGYVPEDIVGHSPLDFVAPEDLANRPPRPLEEIKIAGSVKRERILMHQDGTRLNLLVSSSYMPDGRFQYILQDISERKKIEEALRASEEKFAKSFQSSPDAVTISFIDTGKFIDVNDGFCHMSGYSREEAIGRSAEDLNIWVDRNERSKMVLILQQEGRVRDFETILRRRSGEHVNALLSAEMIEIGGQKCMVVITRDVTERKRMEQELRLSEERYRLVSSVTSDYIYSTVRDDNNHWHQNWVVGAFERITGYTIEEFNNRGGWVSIVHPDDFEKDADAMQKLLNREQVVTENRIIHKDGSVRWVRSYAHPVWDNKQNRLVEIYGAVQDITEQKRIEQELRLSEERYRLVSSVISDYTFSNVQNEKGEIVLNWVAGAFEQISGYTFEEFNARGGWVSTVHPDDLEQDAHDMELLRQNQKVISEIRTIHKDGTIRWVRSYAHPVWDEEKQELVGIYGAVQDITERKRIEEELRLNEERYRIVSSVISDYSFSTARNEKGGLHLTWIAGAFEKITGYTPEEFIARGGWTSILHPDDREKDAQDIENLMKNQRIVSEIRIIHKNGSVRWVRSYSHPVIDEHGSLTGIYGGVQDITEQKLIAQEREKLIEELEAKNVELEQFTYTVSHDLKAPLITIKGFLGFLGVDARAGDIQRVEADIQRINEATDRMHELLTDLLELSRIGRLLNAPETVSFQPLVIEAIGLTEGRLQERGVEMIVPEELPKVYGDRQRLLEVVQNLVDNAAKFMGDQPRPQIEIGKQGETNNGFVTFFVRDNGMGIAPEFHERIFGLFNRLNPKIEGTGIGLALVKRIIEFHGGKIWVQSEVGEGATFYFTLPNVP